MITETRQYMTFKLGDESFAIDVAQVREVLEVSLITKVPTAPEYMRGVVNVRGQATQWWISGCGSGCRNVPIP
ncbi:MAG: chemotaxis protein CheW [Ignavibacteriota bacterium]